MNTLDCQVILKHTNDIFPTSLRSLQSSLLICEGYTSQRQLGDLGTNSANFVACLDHCVHGYFKSTLHAQLLPPNRYSTNANVTDFRIRPMRSQKTSTLQLHRWIGHSATHPCPERKNTGERAWEGGCRQFLKHAELLIAPQLIAGSERPQLSLQMSPTRS